MKRIIAAFLLLVLVFASSVMCENLAENALEKSSEAFYECTKKEKNESMNLIKINGAIDTWEKNKKLIFLISSSDDFDKIEENTAFLKSSLSNYEFQAISRICEESAIILECFAEEYNILLRNIF